MRRLLTTVTSAVLVFVLHPVWASPTTSLGKSRIETRIEKKTLPFQVQYVFSRDVAPGRVRKARDGKDGEVVTTYERLISDGKLINERPIKTEKTEPVAAVFEMTMESTAYTPMCGSGSGRTATGRMARYGVVAVDPRVIPLHSLVFVEGYGFAVAADTGGAIKGNIIDVCFPSRQQCLQWGRRKVKVHVFRERLPRNQ
jgi:3D (Asp-Asp-Asp) domain-containing protein